MATINPRPGPAVERPPGNGSPRSRRATSARPEHFGLAAILALSCLLEFYKLGQNGYANLYYSAGVKSMLRSLHNFFFVSFDPAGLVSVDKPPLGLWLQATSAKIFGFAPLPLLIPEGVCAVLAVALMYFIVAPRLGALAGLLSALALAVFPSFVAVSRDNALDPLLLLLMLAGCGLALKAIESGRTRTLIASALFVGLAFNTKSLAALLCIPGIALGYVICAPTPPWRRVAQLALAAVVLVVVSLSWSLVVDATPASQRPYVGSSSNNSELGLEFGYNGLGRTGGQVGGPPCPEAYPAPTSDIPIFRPASTTNPIAHAASAGSTGVAGVTVRDPNPVPFGSCPSPLRIFGVGLGDQGGWTVPLAVIGLLALVFALGSLRLRATWRDPRTAYLFVLGGWFVLELLALDFSKGIVHPYYVSALGPGLAAMVGAGAAGFTALISSGALRRRLVGLAAAAAAAITTVGIDLLLIHRHGYPEFWRYPLVLLAAAALAAIVVWRRVARWTVAALLLVLLVAPALYSTSVWDAPVDGTFPSAGPYNRAGWGGISLPPDELRANVALASYLRGHHPTKRFAVLTEASDAASPMILLGLSAAAIGGYNTTDKSLTAAGLADLVARHEARYVLVGGPYYDRGGDAGSNAARLVCPQIPQSAWYPSDPTQGVLHLLDCAGRASALRHPFAVARAYLHAHPRTLSPLTISTPHVYEDTSGLSSTVTVDLSGVAAAAPKLAIGSALDPAGGIATLTPAGMLEPPEPVTGLHSFGELSAGPGAATSQRGSYTFTLPPNWYFRVKPAGATITTVTQRFG
ncbi:MAG: glycosyltransferase family 39 protein [Solirubrobacteraceae bacterium]|jgi:4-amino-4-deoxy-L-arabinose transferase-like glycosyltransferase